MTFDVASVRESAETSSFIVSGDFQPRSSSLRITNFDAQNLLSMAYGVRWDQIVGLPESRAMYNVSAKAGPEVDAHLASLSPEHVEREQRHMLQVLLADRFQLKTHWEMRPSAVYDLVLTKKGNALHAATGVSYTSEERAEWGDKPIPAFYQSGDGSRARGYRFIGHGCSMSDITDMLANQFGHPVRDKTGLTGRYDVTLNYYETRTSDRDPSDMNPIPALDEAIQQQLGLKLVLAKGTAQFLVVDHIEKPSAN